MPEKMIAYTDGGSRGNPGPAAAGFVLTGADGRRFAKRGLFLGDATNNAAEYTAVIRAIETALEMDAEELKIFSDSELLVRQLNGEYRVKSENIKPLYEQTVGLLGRLRRWQVRHVVREKNVEADRLVNRALDKKGDVEGQSSSANSQPIRLGALISGSGTTLMNILECIKNGELNASVPVVISSRSSAAGVERAKKAGLEVKVIRRKDFGNVDEFSRCIEEALVEAEVDLVVQGGWLCLWKIPERYENRVMNIHPALLPSFGGQGMWGHHVHSAVLDAGCKVSGCTVHFCTNEYDKGPIIVQRACEAKDTDSPDTLAARVFEQECIAYPDAIRLFAEGRLLVKNGRIKVKE
ncbi:MAG: phosphoribosylglycinamide formyltransferase [Sedimentisphaerales bacterium]|nr:phosphoribosylglycinamide formyltransferase [Sedimentisphaerales bacterium]